MTYLTSGKVTSLSLLFLLLFFATGVPAWAQNVNSRGIWCSSEELKALPTSGRGWENLKSRADQLPVTPRISNQDDDENVRVLARALVYARTGLENYRTAVINACVATIGTERGRTLALGRELGAYVIAADLVGLPETQDAMFRAWLMAVRVKQLSGKTLISTHEDRPNNWGTQAGFSRVAVAAYLGDDEEMARCAKIFRGWLGDRASYNGFTYGDLTWQSDPSHPVGINPVGATILGYSVDGALPEELRRAGDFIWPPPRENYVYTGLEGALGQAIILHRAGYDVWNWQDQALLRAYRWLHQEADFPAVGNDTWQPHVINYYYGTSFPATSPTISGKGVGWTDWTHGSRGAVLTGIHGVVRKGSGATLSRVVVQLQADPGPAFTMQSNSHGCYRFVNIPPGSYTLSFSSTGFEGASETVNVTLGRPVFARSTTLRRLDDDSNAPTAPGNIKVVPKEQGVAGR